MNEKQRLYLVQARSDWKIYHLLKNQSICHQLHYFQMCTEKLAKAFFWSSTGAGKIGHSAFVKFVRIIAANRKVATSLGYSSVVSFGEWIKDVSDLVYELQQLAPALAGDERPNAEYPWPRYDPQFAPVEHQFIAWKRMQTANGHHLRVMIDQILDNFDKWF